MPPLPTRWCLRIIRACLLSLVVGLVTLVGWQADAMAAADPAARPGILVLAHGGTNRWDAMVRKAVRAVDVRAPIDVAFGMAMHRHDVRAFQQVVDRLERKGITELLVIPLLVSSYSMIYRQYEYVFNLRPEPEWEEAGSPLELEVPVVMGSALDDDQAVAAILSERALALSRVADQETIVLIGHGPTGEADQQQWLAVMQRLAEQVKVHGGFHEMATLTMRDDAPADVRKAAIQELRDTVRAASATGRALVVPVLLAQGGVEQKIPKHLAGLSYVFDGQTLLPHANITRWIEEQVRQLGDAAANQASRLSDGPPDG